MSGNPKDVEYLRGMLHRAQNILSLRLLGHVDCSKCKRIRLKLLERRKATTLVLEEDLRRTGC